jgi:hypothetical protein
MGDRDERSPMTWLAVRRFVIEDDAMDVGALLAQPLFFAKVGAIQMGVMRQLPRSTDVRVPIPDGRGRPTPAREQSIGSYPARADRVVRRPRISTTMRWMEFWRTTPEHQWSQHVRDLQ